MGQKKSNFDHLNLGNSIFTGFNDKEGLMICGCEWGFSKERSNRLGKWHI